MTEITRLLSVAVGKATIQADFSANVGNVHHTDHSVGQTPSAGMAEQDTVGHLSQNVPSWPGVALGALPVEVIRADDRFLERWGAEPDSEPTVGLVHQMFVDAAKAVYS